MVRGGFSTFFSPFYYYGNYWFRTLASFFMQRGSLYVNMGPGMNVMSIRAHLTVCRQPWEQSLDWNIKPFKIKLILTER